MVKRKWRVMSVAHTSNTNMSNSAHAHPCAAGYIWTQFYVYIFLVCTPQVSAYIYTRTHIQINSITHFNDVEATKRKRLCAKLKHTYIHMLCGTFVDKTQWRTDRQTVSQPAAICNRSLAPQVRSHSGQWGIHWWLWRMSNISSFC